MSPARRLAVSILTVLLAGHLVGGASTTLALMADSRAVPATFTTAACFVADTLPPVVSSTVIAKTSQYVPGFVRQAGTYYVYANVADAGCAPSGIATVTANVSTLTTGSIAVPLVAGSFSVGGVAYNRRSASITANAVLVAGAKTFSITSTDNATNSQTQSGFSVTVDNTAPTGSTVQTANGGVTVGKPEAGDSVTMTFSEIIDPESVLAGWTGASTNVVVRIANNAGGDILTIRNAANAVQLPLGSVNLVGTAYVTANRDFGAPGTASTMVQSGATITITLGTPSGAAGTQAATGTMVWTPVATPTDRAGNACQTTVANETGTADVEF
ncbi:MAG: hypothetical protein QOD78_2494 [Chloroflexota bacterium]|jgi:hypothetical protein|nr:hypothetical protein [Chloroflexota bacterium]